MELSINGYKSIRSLTLPVKRVNILIGEPNCGKTNVLEGIALMSRDAWRFPERCFRATFMAGLFSDLDIASLINVKVGDWAVSISSGTQPNQFDWTFGGPTAKGGMNLPSTLKGLSMEEAAPVYYYRYRNLAKFTRDETHSLTAPSGGNLASLLFSNRRLRNLAEEIFNNHGFRLEVRAHEKEISITKDLDGVLISFPYQSASETLRRMVFYLLALETNAERILVLDEPEANTFPKFTKILAERIAGDDRKNQFFITTHNPYLLHSLIEKTTPDDLQVVHCWMEDFETKARPLGEKTIQRLLDLEVDAFFNLDELGEE